MKITLLTHSFSPEVSPPQRRWSVFVDEFAKLGHDITVVTPTPRGAGVHSHASYAAEGQVKIRRYPSISRSKSRLGKLIKHGMDALIGIPSAFFGKRPDVLIATVPALPTLFVGYFVSRIRRVPFVVDLRDAWPDLLRESRVLRWDWIEPFISNLLSFVVARSDLLVTVTRGLETRMRARGVKNVSTIPNGVDLERSVPTWSIEPRGQKLRVLYLGNLGKSQGLDLVLRSIQPIREIVELRIVGRGTEKTRLMQLAEDLGVRVDFRNSVYGEQVLGNYAWADTCIVSLRPDWPSFAHTVPSKLYELLYFDRHITGLVRGEAAEILMSAGSGSVVVQDQRALTSHFKRLASDHTLLATSSGGSEWIRKNASLRSSATEFSKLLEDLIQNKSNS